MIEGINANDLDRYITGNYGEDYFYSEMTCWSCGEYTDPEACPICGEYQLTEEEIREEVSLRRWEEQQEERI